MAGCRTALLDLADARDRTVVEGASRASAGDWAALQQGFLARAYATDLCTWAVVEQDPSPHMCNSAGRYGSKLLMELSYQPLLGGVDWGTRAGLPLERLRHETSGRAGLPAGVSLRIWREGRGVDAFEAANAGGAPASWRVAAATGIPGDVPGLSAAELNGAPAPADGDGFCLTVAAGQSVRGRLRWQR